MPGQTHPGHRGALNPLGATRRFRELGIRRTGADHVLANCCLTDSPLCLQLKSRPPPKLSSRLLLESRSETRLAPPCARAHRERARAQEPVCAPHAPIPMKAEPLRASSSALLASQRDCSAPQVLSKTAVAVETVDPDSDDDDGLSSGACCRIHPCALVLPIRPPPPLFPSSVAAPISLFESFSALCPSQAPLPALPSGVSLPSALWRCWSGCA